MKNIQIPIQLIHPEAESRTVLFGAKMALEADKHVILSYYLDAGGSSDAVTHSIQSQNSGFDHFEMFRQQEEFILNTLIEYQNLILRSLHPSPSVTYMIISDHRPDRSILESGMEDTGMYLLCGENLETHTFSWIREINSLILNNGKIPILVHNPEREFSHLRRIVYGINNGKLEEAYFRKLAALFNPDRTEILALYITGEVDTNRLMELTSQLERIKSETGYHNMKMETMVTREKLNPFNLSNSFAVDREADLLVCPGCNPRDQHGAIASEEVHRQVSGTEIPFMIYY